jgi:hypothetical protein
METKMGIFAPLLERAEQFSKTSFNLVKLKALDKMADVVSTIVARLCVAVIFLVFIIVLSFAASFWLGELLGKTYYGFLCVAAFYGLLGIVLYVSKPLIKSHAYDSIISEHLNEDHEDDKN